MFEEVIGDGDRSPLPERMIPAGKLRIRSPLRIQLFISVLNNKETTFFVMSGGV
jgi:hypothetical protein